MPVKKVNEAPAKDAMGLNAGTLGDEVNHLVGNTATLLTKPDNSVSILYLSCEVGNFRIKNGDATGTITSATPSASVTDGSGTWKISEGEQITIAAPKDITVIGDSAESVLTYFWV